MNLYDDVCAAESFSRSTVAAHTSASGTQSLVLHCNQRWYDGAGRHSAVSREICDGGLLLDDAFSYQHLCSQCIGGCSHDAAVASSPQSWPLVFSLKRICNERAVVLSSWSLSLSMFVCHRHRRRCRRCYPCCCCCYCRT